MDEKDGFLVDWRWVVICCQGQCECVSLIRLKLMETIVSRLELPIHLPQVVDFP